MKIQKTDNLTVYCLDPQWPSFFSINRIISNDRILYINRIFPIDRIVSINIIFSIDRIFLTISNSEKKKIQKTDNLTVYCLDPQWPSGPLRSNHYSIELIEFLLLLEIFLSFQFLSFTFYIHVHVTT